MQPKEKPQHGYIPEKAIRISREMRRKHPHRGPTDPNEPKDFEELISPDEPPDEQIRDAPPDDTVMPG